MANSVFTVTMTSGQTQPTSGIDLGENGWDQITIIYPSAPSGSVGMYVSHELDGAYYRYAPESGDGLVNSSLAINGIAAGYSGGFRFIKPFNTSGTADLANEIKIICSRY